MLKTKTRKKKEKYLNPFVDTVNIVLKADAPILRKAFPISSFSFSKTFYAGIFIK